MARKTFADFDTQLHMALGKRQDFDSTVRGQLINSAYLYVANAIRHPEIETTDSPTLLLNTDNVALASDFWFAELVMNTTDNIPIRPSSIPLIEVRSIPAGNPATYTPWGSSLYFDKKPTASKTLKIWYTKRPADLSGTSTSILDQLYDQLIQMYSIKFGLEELRDWEQAAKAMLAIRVYETEIKAPWRMRKTEDSHKSLRIRMR